ncbi:uncharacterized protein M6B38_122805 [Iris pallida]|uniref:Uncharacterized protein n=1 Tax=Iris pallida TaxID=29817 RepID=A0AAX6H3K3_IRIPA|nr:uncharacterized protein M6B38_122805 [Iris pallida]
MAPTTASSIGRSLLSLRHRSEQQVHSMDGHDSPDSDPILSFDRQASSLLLSLLPSAAADDADDAASFLSVSWIGKLLRSFLLLLDDFTALLLLRANPQTSPPLSRLLSDFSDRSVKALDLLNAVRDGLDRVRHCSAHLDIVLPALNGGRLHRARKSLSDLSLLLLAEPDPALLPTRNRSFSHDPNHHHRRRQLRTALSWSVSRSWSAARQLHAMGSNLSPPKPADISGTAGLAIPIFTISSVLLFVSWVLVAAIPCQDRGLQAHLSAPRNYPWAAPMAALQEKILEEHRKRERKDHGASGLMREISVIEKGTRSLVELLGRPVAVVDEELAKEGQLRELEGVREGLKEGLEGLERQLREVFHRIVRSRTEGLDCLSRSSSH